MGEILPLTRPAPDQPQLRPAVHQADGSVLVPAETFRLVGDALEHARHELVSTGHP